MKEATAQVISAGALPTGFQRVLGLVCSKYLASGLHGCERSAVSFDSLGAFRSAVARAVWLKTLAMTNISALLKLLDAPCGSAPAFFFISSGFRHMRWYPAYRPDEEGRIYWLVTMRPEINSNDFGRFGNYVVDSIRNLSSWELSPKNNSIFCVRSSSHKQ